MVVFMSKNIDFQFQKKFHFAKIVVNQSCEKKMKIQKFITFKIPIFRKEMVKRVKKIVPTKKQ